MKLNIPDGETIAVAGLALMLSVLVLGNMIPLPVSGLYQLTQWSELLAKGYGKAAAGLSILLVLIGCVTSKRPWLILLSMPAILLIWGNPDRYTLAPTPVSSLLELGKYEIRENIQSETEELKQFVSQIQEGGSENPIRVARSGAKEILSWSDYYPYTKPIKMVSGIFLERTQGPFIGPMKLPEKPPEYVTIPNFRDKFAACVEGFLNIAKIRGLEATENDIRQWCPSVDNIPTGGDRETAKQGLQIIDYSKARHYLLSYAADMKPHIDLIRQSKKMRSDWRLIFFVGSVAIAAMVFAAMRLPSGVYIPFLVIALVLPFEANEIASDFSLTDGTIATLLFLLAVALFSRMLRLLWLDNQKKLERLSLFRRWVVGYTTLIYFLPFPLIAFIAVLSSRVLEDHIASKFYGNKVEIDIPIQSSVCFNIRNEFIISLDSRYRNLPHDLDLSVSCIFQGIFVKAKSMNMEAAADSATGGSKNVAISVFDSIYPESLPCISDGKREDSCISSELNYDDCGFLNLICELKYLPNKIADKKYKNIRAEHRRSYLGGIDNIVNGVAENISEDRHKEIILDEIGSSEIRTREGLRSMFAGWGIYKLFGLAFLVNALIKSFGYTLARITCKKSPLQQGQVPSNSNITIKSGHHHSISKPGSYYIRWGAQPAGATTSGWGFPNPFHLLIARFPWRLLFDRLDLSVGEVANFDTTNARRFIALELKDGQEVAFDMNKLYCFSKGIRFRRKWDFNFATLLRGHCSLKVAEGPGTVIFLSEGETKNFSKASKAPKDAIPPERLIVWSPRNEFDVKSRLSFSSFYTGNIAYLPQPGTLAVFDADAGRAWFTGGLRFIPRLFIPI